MIETMHAGTYHHAQMTDQFCIRVIFFRSGTPDWRDEGLAVPFTFPTDILKYPKIEVQILVVVGTTPEIDQLEISQ
jgi:hypothetical protein